MKTEEYIKQYSSGNRFYFKDVLVEFCELFGAILKFDEGGVVEEFRDVCVHLQIWLYYRFGINGEAWIVNMKAAEKYGARQIVWRKIYSFVGLDENISGYSGNYLKLEKVIIHLARFGIREGRARDAYQKIVLNSNIEKL
ncbi:MAG: hypothetical protein HY813_03115 [Candidatus Portnoybacteria bacterium]|nr:hypothetical protein [Candidatus Portnoybacteria bacterium]